MYIGEAEEWAKAVKRVGEEHFCPRCGSLFDDHDFIPNFEWCWWCQIGRETALMDLNERMQEVERKIKELRRRVRDLETQSRKK
jgi:hypothetical protein